jgi:transcriptional regulator with XRE-family HTH domain
MFRLFGFALAIVDNCVAGRTFPLALVNHDIGNMASQSDSMAETIKFCGIKVTELAELSGISRTTIYEFRHGKANPTIDVVERLLGVMEEHKPGSRRFFYLTCADVAASPEEQVDTMTPQQAAAYMRAIASKFLLGSKKNSDTRESTDELHQLVTLPS